MYVVVGCIFYTSTEDAECSRRPVEFVTPETIGVWCLPLGALCNIQAIKKEYKIIKKNLNCDILKTRAVQKTLKIVLNMKCPTYVSSITLFVAPNQNYIFFLCVIRLLIIETMFKLFLLNCIM